MKARLAGWVIAYSVLLACTAVADPGEWQAVGEDVADADLPALQQLAEKLERQLGRVLQRNQETASVIALVVEGDNSILGQEGRLAQELERLVLYRLDAGPAVEKTVALGAGGQEAIERARSLGATSLLRCVVGVESGSIHVTAELTPLHVPFWDRLVDPVPRGAREHLFVSAAVDEEIMLLLGKSRAPPPMSGWHLKEILYVPHRVLDVGIGDLDGAQGEELVLLLDGSIEVYSLFGRQPRRLTTHDLTRLPVAEVRVRDPVGSLLVVDFNRDGRAEVFAKLFNRRWGEIYVWSGTQLRPVRKLAQVPLCVVSKGGRAHVIYGKPEPGTNRYLPEIEIADINASSGRSLSVERLFTNMRCWQNRDGGSPWILLVDLDGRLQRLELPDRISAIQSEAGAGMGVVDLDGDGVPEMILSESVWPGELDSVRVLARSETVWKSREVVGGVVAVAGGTAQVAGDTRAVLVAVEPGGSASRIYLLGR